MSAKDIFHDAVRNGLEKEGWVITDDPLRIRAGRVDMQIDLGAKKIIAAEKGEEKIAVEIRSFISPSNISEFHTALGQFLNYRIALEEQQPERVLYLAVPQGAYKTFFNLPFVETVIKRFQLSLLVYDSTNEVILEWKR
ncbi:XisH family protein [Nostoc sp. UCD121]|uniref:XisH family protein n=1 Tax=unclassified Nostoc TaxID=2593658 RepID=UPI001629006A|nr:MULTISPECIES: XisH family protein [unclassified Nostoc]MBC1218457.1 XisH family protein [Nostoc sp. UCD120]MBC1277706.1 XisH family protein [Nostoc sp. UCD121]MBC1295975.1 XisH family protein [Nostoc sp. UCD122]